MRTGAEIKNKYLPFLLSMVPKFGHEFGQTWLRPFLPPRMQRAQSYLEDFSALFAGWAVNVRTIVRRSDDRIELDCQKWYSAWVFQPGNPRGDPGNNPNIYR
jgi:hypothetical protein